MDMQDRRYGAPLRQQDCLALTLVNLFKLVLQLAALCALDAVAMDQ